MALGIGVCFALLGACTQNPKPQLTPVEQLPNPETGKEKPQVFLLLDSDTLFWNSPRIDEIDSKLRIRTHLFVGQDKGALEGQLREFHARSNDLLVLASDRLEVAALASGIYTHPSRSLTFNMSPRVEGIVRWELSKLFELVVEFCKSPQIACRWDEALIGKLQGTAWKNPPLLSPNPKGEELRITFDTGEEASSPTNKLLLSLDWVLWLEQILRDLRRPEAAQSSAPWKILSLQNGNLRLSLHTQTEALARSRNTLEEQLIQLRMKYLK